MKPVLRTFLAATLVCVTPQLAEACHGVTQLARQSIAFADVIFEGSLTDVRKVPVDWSKNRAPFYELTFNVHDVVRGKLQQNEIVVGWRHRSYRNAPELNVEYFKKTFGETTRVAVSTPQLADLFCELKLRAGNFYDEDTGTLVFGKRMQPVCDASAASLEPAFRENIPFVLSNSYACGSSYLYPVEKYEKMRDYYKNLAAYEQAVGEGLRLSSDLFLEKTGGVGPLPWNEFRNNPTDNIAIDLLREESDFFTPSLKMNAVWQASLLDLGEAKMKEKSASYGTDFPRDEAARVKFRKSLKRVILRLSDYMEKDPEYRNRLLQED